MRQLYPEIEPYNTFQLKMDDHHAVHVEECGNKEGIPVIFLHGGPGSGCNENHRRYFNPDQYRIILFDQRGCHRSTPRGNTENNTTQDLLNDMEKIRQQLKIEKWVLFGGSWGATLALLYAQAHPEYVAGMIVRGSFLARQQDLDWFLRNGANKIFPDFWQDFIEDLPDTEREDPVSYYYNRVHAGNLAERKAAAQAWAMWAGRVVTYLLADVDPYNYQVEDLDLALDEVSIETHYALHNYFIEENQILDNTDKLPRVPTCIIHGRKDLTCTVDSSWLLHKALPHAELNIVKEGGHLAGEPPMVDALVSATDKMAGIVK